MWRYRCIEWYERHKPEIDRTDNIAPLLLLALLVALIVVLKHKP